MNTDTLNIVANAIEEALKCKGMPHKGLDIARLLPIELLYNKLMGYLTLVPGTVHKYSVKPEKWWNLKYYSGLLGRLDLAWDGRNTVTDLRKTPSAIDDPSLPCCRTR